MKNKINLKIQLMELGCGSAGRILVWQPEALSSIPTWLNQAWWSTSLTTAPENQKFKVTLSYYRS